MVKVCVVPEHPLAVGVALIVAVMGLEPVFFAVNEGIFPVPLVAKPMAVLELVHAKVVPATSPLKLMGAAATPLQYSWLVKTNGVGVGLTVMVNVFEIPLQPNAFDGVTVTVATTGEIPVLLVVKTGIFPVPLAANPMEGVLLVHEKVVPVTALLKVIPFCGTELQSVKLLTAFTVASGSTVIVNFFGVPKQPLREGVTVIVAVKTVVPAFVSVNGFMFPEPVKGSPIFVLLFAQL